MRIKRCDNVYPVFKMNFELLYCKNVKDIKKSELTVIISVLKKISEYSIILNISEQIRGIYKFPCFPLISPALSVVRLCCT